MVIHMVAMPMRRLEVISCGLIATRSYVLWGLHNKTNSTNRSASVLPMVVCPAAQSDLSKTTSEVSSKRWPTDAIGKSLMARSAVFPLIASRFLQPPALSSPRRSRIPDRSRRGRVPPSDSGPTAEIFSLTLSNRC